MSEIIKKPIKFGDLLQKGALFEIDANREDFDHELFDECDDDVEEINDEQIEKNPCTVPFEELRRKMIPLSNFLHKRIIKEGNLDIPPNSKVIVDYNGYFEGQEQSFDSTYMRGKPLKLCLGMGEVLEGIEEAVKTMKKGEESQFLISYNLLYGEQGCPPRCPPKADALFIIRCKDFQEIFPGLENADPENPTKFEMILKKAANLDLEAKSAFRKGQYSSAITKYKKAADDIQFAQLKDEAEEQQQKAMLRKLFLNLAVCYLKVDQPKKTCIMINNLRDVENVHNNAKALFQEGKALRLIGQYDNARRSLRRAAKLKPDDENIAIEIRILEDKVKQVKDAEIQMCKNALGVVTSIAAKEPKTTKSEIDDKTTEMFRARIQEFMDGNSNSLTLTTGHLDAEIVQCIKKLESVLNFKLVTEDTSSGTNYKLQKL
uniref:peptidylprolyl isomerase n=1 Tax=Culicoides sonorensis TaxID=179676 RepID=A0A336L5J2_CULSO